MVVANVDASTVVTDYGGSIAIKLEGRTFGGHVIDIEYHTEDTIFVDTQGEISTNFLMT